MRLLTTLAFAAAMTIGTASASTYYVVGACGSFNNPSPNSPLTGVWNCPTAASLGITGPLTVASEFIVYDSDYSSGLANTVVTVTNWAFTGVTAQFSTDTTTVQGGSSSGGPVSTDGLALNPLTNLPPIVLAGFDDTVSGFGTATVSWTNQATTGSALQSTGYAEVVYDYNVNMGTPEPVSMVLMGSGLAALFFARRKFAKS